MAKSLRAVFFPNEFEPFPNWTAADLAARWKTNPHWVLAHMAHTAYHPEPKVREVLGRLGATARFYDHDGAQAILGTWPDKAILAFRGSEPRETGEGTRVADLVRRIGTLLRVEFSPELARWLSTDVLADLTFRQTPFDDRQGVEVHAGFLREIDKLWRDPLVPDLESVTRGVPTWVTGHSLGAAMATLAAMRRPFHGVVTFGEPRVGRGIDGVLPAATHVRYVNGDDPVTKIPPEFMRYGHHGHAAQIADADGSRDFRYDHAIIYYADNLARA